MSFFNLAANLCLSRSTYFLYKSIILKRSLLVTMQPLHWKFLTVCSQTSFSCICCKINCFNNVAFLAGPLEACILLNHTSLDVTQPRTCLNLEELFGKVKSDFGFMSVLFFAIIASFYCLVLLTHISCLFNKAAAYVSSTSHSCYLSLKV